MNQKVDTIIHARWLVPVVPTGQVLENHSLAIRDDRIYGLLPTGEAGQWEATETLNLSDHAVLPGLVNCHGHAAMTLLRGYADDYPLMPWLQDHIWPAEARHMSEEFVRDGVNLALAEMIRSGTTCFSDMYFFPNITAQASQHAGLRCQISFPVLDFPSAWGSDADDYISKGLQLRDDLKHSDLVSVVFGPHSPYTVAETALAKIATLAAELDLPIHIHLHETAEEVAESLQARGLRPLAYLNELGLIGPRTQCVHMTTLDQDDIELLQATGAHVIHCPAANMKLGAGSCPVNTLLEAGVNVALGTDGAASNNDLSLLGEMRSAALLAKLSQHDATVLPAQTALQMATINGARALGMEEKLGSLEAGKLADVIAIDLSAVETQPVYNPLSQLVYSAAASQVSHSWVGGECIMADRQLLQLDLASTLARSSSWGETIARGDASDG
jgi:5-methylthioadenosine/S-adenosylhomocysteine deaminase